MIIDNTAGFGFFLTEDIYLVKNDMDKLNALVTEPVVPSEEPVSGAVEEVIVPATAALTFEYTGNNQKQFLILCSYPGLDEMDAKHLEALKSALQRKELTLDDVAILNLAKYTDANIDKLQTYFKPQRLLILGQHCLLTGWDKFALNQLENLDSVKALYTYSFTEMMGDRDKTKAFWEQMKVL